MAQTKNTPKISYWLMKSEPDVYPWSQLVEEKSARWDGVRNYEARNNLRAMKLGDLVFFYHSNEGREIVGVARVKTTSYQDPTTTEDWSVVDIEPVQALVSRVTLQNIKESPKLKEMILLKKMRLSVSPVRENEFTEILKMAKTSLTPAA